MQGADGAQPHNNCTPTAVVDSQPMHWHGRCIITTRPTIKPFSFFSGSIATAQFEFHSNVFERMPVTTSPCLPCAPPPESYASTEQCAVPSDRPSLLLPSTTASATTITAARPGQSSLEAAELPSGSHHVCREERWQEGARQVRQDHGTHQQAFLWPEHSVL